MSTCGQRKKFFNRRKNILVLSQNCNPFFLCWDIAETILTKTNSLKKFRTLKLISGAGFLFFLCLLLQEFLFQLPSTLPFLLYYLAIGGVLYGIYQWKKASIQKLMAKLREKHMLLPAAILAVLAGVLLFYDFIGFLTYLGTRLIWAGISLVPYLYFRYKEKEAQETLPTENIYL